MAQTLEEAAEKSFNDSEYLIDKPKYTLGFIEGAKWQQNRMYSEDEVLVILDKFLTSMIKGEKTGLIKEWFETFKNQ